MYNNLQEPLIYDTNDTYPQSIYEQNPYVNSIVFDQSPQPIYGPVSTQPPPYMADPSQPSFIDNTYIIQEPQPIYQTLPQQPQQPIYQTLPQQPPPPYTAAIQPIPPTATYVQQPQLVPCTVKLPAAPFTKGYKWPHKSTAIVCPICGISVHTRIKRQITIITLLGSLILFFISCILVCLPCFVPACKKTTHYCPHCNSILGVRRPLR